MTDSRIPMLMVQLREQQKNIENKINNFAKLEYEIS